MKLKTFIKLGAVGVAAATAAAGSLVLTTKAVKKLDNGETKPGNDDLKNIAVDKIISGGQKISDMAKSKAAQNEEESTFKADFTSFSAPKPNVVQGHVVHDISSYETSEPGTFENLSASVSEPVASAPIPTAVPDPIPTPIPTPIPEPIPVAVPTPDIQMPTPVDNAAGTAKPEEKADDEYTYIPMELPYLAGKLGKDDEECAEVIITPAEHKAQEEAEANAEETAVAEESVVSEEPVLEVPSEPEITLPTAEPIDEHPTTEPIFGSVTEEPATTFADINPLEQGFAVGMADIDGQALPTAVDTRAPETFADIAPIEEAPAPVTFGDLNPDPVESALPMASEAVAETVEQPIEAALEPEVSEPVLAAAPVVEAVETPAETLPVAETPVVETPAEPVAVVAEPIIESTSAVSGKEICIGSSVVSDKADNAAILAVANTFGLSAQNLVAITAEQTMVFEFLYSDMRNDATLINVFFVLPNGQATMPPEAERESVIAFARNFITANEELKKFLAN